MTTKKLKMTLTLAHNRTVDETKDDFNRAYPFLRLDFYYNTEPGFARRHLTGSNSMLVAGLKKNGELDIPDSMTVGELERNFLEQYGLNVQLSRKSGKLWLETTITDRWTLKQQNDHGRELSEHPSINRIVDKGGYNPDRIDYDFL